MVDERARPPGEERPRRHRVLRVSVLSYLIFCVLAPLSEALPKSVFGEFVDILMMSAFVWPYPLLLSLQRLVSPDSWISFGAADVLGLVLVAGLGRAIDRRWGDRMSAPLAVLAGLVAWPVLLAVVQLVAIGLALALGWPVWE